MLDGVVSLVNVCYALFFSSSTEGLISTLYCHPPVGIVLRHRSLQVLPCCPARTGLFYDCIAAVML